MQIIFIFTFTMHCRLFAQKDAIGPKINKLDGNCAFNWL